jgi:UDPglucose 6-dehydrogenase
LNITVIGVGYVGLVTGACFAELGNHVTCVDIDNEKISQLASGQMPFYEPGLHVLVTTNIANQRLHFVNSLQEVTVNPEIIFIAVGTPAEPDGSVDMQYVLEVARQIGQTLQDYCVIVDKSTVPIGVAEQVKKVIQAELKLRHLNLKFDVVSNPEFLREGAAIADFMQPDRIIVGLSSNKARLIMQDLYLPIIRNPEKIYFMSVKDAEMTKYAANAMLAARISYMNEIAILCEQFGVDVENVRMGIGSDTRIGNLFIYPGCGYGGSCFSQDVKAWIKMAETKGVDPVILRAIEARNDQQKRVLAQKVIDLFGNDLSEIVIGVWGLSFKPGTDDMREASSIVLLEKLLACNAQIQAYDPAAIPAAKRFFPSEWLNSGKLHFMEHQYAALKNADALILVTEWQPFCYPDFVVMKKLMRRYIILDGRNQYDPKQLKEEKFEYYGIGRA